MKKEKDLVVRLVENKKKKLEGKKNLSPLEISRLEFAALVVTQREELGITQQELADALGIHKSSVKQIENGEKKMEKNRELLKSVCRELELSFRGACKRFGLEEKSETEVMDLAKAKRDFVYALEKSKNYRDFFIQVFRIAEVYKVPFRSKTDEEFDKIGSEVLLMGEIEKFEQLVYSAFFLDLIYGLTFKNDVEKRKAGKIFFKSRLAKSLSEEDWSVIFNNIDIPLRETIYAELEQQHLDSKIRLREKKLSKKF
jgi:transcriptional regulator with XRE-family HTH domain